MLAEYTLHYLQYRNLNELFPLYQINHHILWILILPIHLEIVQRLVEIIFTLMYSNSAIEIIRQM